jgi:6-pyruvoyltetrahydropterin/6-carboxytetrahydropterin synthase
MYSLGLQRDFIAQHFLIGGDWGAENELHSHAFRLEVRLSNDKLDQHGYVIDLVDLESQIDNLLGRYRDTTLNDLPEFEGLNPSVEHFARILFQALSSQNLDKQLTSLEVRLWENNDAWASYQEEF